MRHFEKDSHNSTSNSLTKSIPEEGEDEVSTATTSSTTATTTTGEPTLQRRATPRIIPRRKMSFPAVSISTPQMKQQFASVEFSTLTRNSGGYESLLKSSDLQVVSDNYQRRFRRFSNVSDAVSRKLSTTIGWRSVSVQDIICQAKSLCGQYIRMRLKRSGIFHRRLGLQRLRSTNNLPVGTNGVLGEVFAQLQIIGSELELMHPKLYSCICRQVAVTMTNEKSVSCILSSVARNLLKVDVTWAKIASLYCVAGGLAVDCVRQGHPEYLFGIVETMGLVIERDAAMWIAQQGGWPALLSRYRPPDDDTGAFQMIALSVLCLIVLLLGAIFVLRTIGKMAFGNSAAPSHTIPL